MAEVEQEPGYKKTRLGWIPAEWEVTPIENSVHKVIDCPHSTPKWEDRGVICLRTSNLTPGSWNWQDIRYVSEEDYLERTKRSRIYPGDIILSREGTMGGVAIVSKGMKFCMGQRLVQIRPNPNRLMGGYLLHILLYVLDPIRISKLMAGSTSKHLNVGEIKRLEIPLPPLPEQQKIAQTLSTWDKAIETLEKQRDALKTQKRGLMQKLLTGEVRVKV